MYITISLSFTSPHLLNTLFSNHSSFPNALFVLKVFWNEKIKRMRIFESYIIGLKSYMIYQLEFNVILKKESCNNMHLVNIKENRTLKSQYFLSQKCNLKN